MRKLDDALWQRYREGNDEEARALLLDRYLGLVHYSARELLKRITLGLEFDDLVSAGTVGLVQALEGFDPSRGLAFSTYAMPRIRGAMLDEMRTVDWMPRSVRARRRLLAQTRARLQHQLGRVPSSREMADELGLDLTTYWRKIGEADAWSMVALEQTAVAGVEGGSRLYETIPDLDSREPVEAMTREQVLAELREAFAALTARDRLVLTLYYYEGLSLKQIGEVLHVTESRISQIRTRALKRLRERVGLMKEDI